MRYDAVAGEFCLCLMPRPCHSLRVTDFAFVHSNKIIVIPISFSISHASAGIYGHSLCWMVRSDNRDDNGFAFSNGGILYMIYK